MTASTSHFFIQLALACTSPRLNSLYQDFAHVPSCLRRSRHNYQQLKGVAVIFCMSRTWHWYLRSNIRFGPKSDTVSSGLQALGENPLSQLSQCPPLFGDYSRDFAAVRSEARIQRNIFPDDSHRRGTVVRVVLFHLEPRVNRRSSKKGHVAATSP